ncbi:MAG: hypothetical protein K1060chlam2_00125 [Chlamydiae bacterium]|nr:hypothetical protein [Chlamydiota bacterium]
MRVLPITTQYISPYLSTYMNRVLRMANLSKKDLSLLFTPEGVTRRDHQKRVWNVRMQYNEYDDGIYIRIMSAKELFVWIKPKISLHGRNYFHMSSNGRTDSLSTEKHPFLSFIFNRHFRSILLGKEISERAPKFKVKGKIKVLMRARAASFFDQKNHNLIPDPIRDRIFPLDGTLREREADDGFDLDRGSLRKAKRGNSGKLPRSILHRFSALRGKEGLYLNDQDRQEDKLELMKAFEML